MIEKTVRKAKLSEFSEIRENLEYWLKKTPEERVAAALQLREDYYGSETRLQRVGRVIQRPRG